MLMWLALLRDYDNGSGNGDENYSRKRYNFDGAEVEAGVKDGQYFGWC